MCESRFAHPVVVSKTGTPPAAGTSIMPFPMVPTIIMPARFQAPPMIMAKASHMSLGGPPEMSTFFNLFPA